MPVWMAVVTLIGLILAILGTGMWHIFSWIALSAPVYIMYKYGKRFFIRKGYN